MEGDKFCFVLSPSPTGRGGGGEGLRAQKLVALFTKASPTHLIDWVSVSPQPNPSPRGRGEKGHFARRRATKPHTAHDECIALAHGLVALSEVNI